MSAPPIETLCHAIDDAAIAAAAHLIQSGAPVAVPTETVYGLAADATNPAAVAAIYAAKGRPSFNPLIVHVANQAMAEKIAQFSATAARITDAFWPGPLTLVLPLQATHGIAAAVTAGLPTIAIRMPAHPVMQRLIQASGVPLAAPSANRSGAISPTTAAHVLHSLAGRIPLVLDGGPTADGLESTIVAVEQDHLRLLRPGPIDPTAIAEIAGCPVVRVSDGTTIEAPGQMLSHYAPGKPVRLNVQDAKADEFLIGFGPMDCHANLSEAGSLAEAASGLFAMLHLADASPYARIAVAPIPTEGVGDAINDRLRRAAA